MEFEAKSGRDGAWWEFNAFPVEDSSGWDFNASSCSIWYLIFSLLGLGITWFNFFLTWFRDYLIQFYFVTFFARYDVGTFQSHRYLDKGDPVIYQLIRTACSNAMININYLGYILVACWV
jgi:hypothetical protein